MSQRSFRFRTWGGRRRGAGRKRSDGTGVPHVERPQLRRRVPVHVTLRMRREVWNLRSRRCFGAIRRAFWGGRDRFGFRLNEFSVQGNHVHLIVEVDDTTSLTRGTMGLEIRIAKRLNRVMRRRGKVFADRYHAHVLRTPGEVRRARNYVLQNARKHYGVKVDEYSSTVVREIVMTPRTWLLLTACATPRTRSSACP